MGTLTLTRAQLVEWFAIEVKIGEAEQAENEAKRGRLYETIKTPRSEVSAREARPVRRRAETRERS